MSLGRKRNFWCAATKQQQVNPSGLPIPSKTHLDEATLTWHRWFWPGSPSWSHTQLWSMASWTPAAVSQQWLFWSLKIPAAPQWESAAAPPWSSQTLVQENRQCKVTCCVHGSEGKEGLDCLGKCHFHQLPELNVDFGSFYPNLGVSFAKLLIWMQSAPTILGPLFKMNTRKSWNLPHLKLIFSLGVSLLLFHLFWAGTSKSRLTNQTVMTRKQAGIWG